MGWLLVFATCTLCMLHGSRARDCLLSSSLEFQDEHDGDRKQVALSGNQLKITPAGNTQSWVVFATLDPAFCNASINFDVPGKPNPPPVKLTATLWTESHYMPTGTVEKNAIEFTDPSGTIGPPSLPLNTWVQLDNFATEQNPSGAPENCLEGSPFVFKDEHDGDSKLVTLSGNQLKITPFQSNDRWEVYATMDPTFCNASINFNVPGKPNPPPVDLTATIWTQSLSLTTGTVKKYAIEFTDPSGTLGSPSTPLNTWVQIEAGSSTSMAPFNMKMHKYADTKGTVMPKWSISLIASGAFLFAIAIAITICCCCCKECACMVLHVFICECCSRGDD